MAYDTKRLDFQMVRFIGGRSSGFLNFKFFRSTVKSLKERYSLSGVTVILVLILLLMGIGPRFRYINAF